jgi:hypothetical protein
MSDHLSKREAVRIKDSRNLGLIIAEIEDMKTRHLSMKFRLSCITAMEELGKAQSRLLELNDQFRKVADEN